MTHDLTTVLTFPGKIGKFLHERSQLPTSLAYAAVSSHVFKKEYDAYNPPFLFAFRFKLLVDEQPDLIGGEIVDRFLTFLWRDLDDLINTTDTTIIEAATESIHKEKTGISKEKIRGTINALLGNRPAINVEVTL